ncbi:MAG: hypothetical protein ABIO46_09850 [Chitinophagales bacterium]
MKSPILFLFFSILVGQLTAQSDSGNVAKPLVIEDITKAMSKGTQPGFRIDIPQVKKKGTVEALSKAMKAESRANLEQVNNEYIVRGTTIKSISPRPLNVYGIVNEYEDHVELLFFYEADSAFLSKEKNETEYLSARKYTRDFAVQAYRGAVQERIDLENSKLKDLQSQLDGLNSEQDKLKKTIDAENQNIEKTRQKIATSEKDQERVGKLVQDQKALVDQARSSKNEGLEKEEQKKLNGFESDLSKLAKQEDGYHKEITNSEENIREYKRTSSDNDGASQVKQEDVAKQKDLINKLQKRLESIQ